MLSPRSATRLLVELVGLLAGTLGLQFARAIGDCGAYLLPGGAVSRIRVDVGAQFAQAAVDVAGTQHLQRLLEVVDRAVVGSARFQRGDIHRPQLLRAIPLDAGDALAIDVAQRLRGFVIVRIERQYTQHRLRSAVGVATFQRAGADLQLFAHTLADRRVDRVLFAPVFLLAGRKQYDNVPLLCRSGEIARVARLPGQLLMLGDRARARVLREARARRDRRRLGGDRRLRAGSKQRGHDKRRRAAQPLVRAQCSVACVKVASFERNTSMPSPPKTMLRRSMNG